MTDLADVGGEPEVPESDRDRGEETAQRQWAAKERPRLDPEEEADVEAILEELGGSAALVQVWRLGADGSRALVGSFAPEDFSIDFVARDHGPGRYIARVKDAKGAWIKGTNTRFAIDDSYGGRASVRPAADEPPAWARPLVDAIHQLATSRAAPASAADPFEVAAKLGGVAAQQMTGMITLLAPLLQAMAKPQRSGPSMEKVLEVLSTGIQLGREAAGDGRGSSSVLTELGARLIQQMDAARAAGGAGAPALPAPAAPETPGQETDQVRMMAIRPADPDSPFAPLRPVIPRLLELAARRVDVGEWTPVIEMYAPEAVQLLETIAARRGPEQALATFLRTWPQAAEHEPWFRQLLEELLSGGEDQEGEDVEPPE